MLDQDKLSFIFHYLSWQQQDVFEKIDGYALSGLTAFKAAIDNTFKGVFNEKQYIECGE
jgi:hypothetical protein